MHVAWEEAYGQEFEKMDPQYPDAKAQALFVPSMS